MSKFISNTGRMTPPIIHIRAEDFVDWANRFETPALLPVLLRQLVNTTCQQNDVLEIEFPSDESITYAGWDGRLNVTTGFQSYVPAGLSCWELSKQKDIKSKLESDIKKRSKDFSENELKMMSFVFVTPRKWTHQISKVKWESTMRKKYGWKHVKILDSVNLAEWIEHSVPAQVYFANMTGRSFEIDGITPSSRFWLEWTADIESEFPRSLFDRSIIDNKNKLNNFLKDGSCNMLEIVANSFDEGLAFLHCALSNEPLDEDICNEEKRERLENQRFLDRMVAVKKENIIRDFSALDKEFIPIFWKNEIKSEYGKTGPNKKAIQIVGVNETIEESDNCSRIKIKNLTSIDFSNALRIEKGTMEDLNSVAKTEDRYKKSGGSLTVLRRQLSKNKTQLPEWWKDGTVARKLIPFMLVGFWKVDLDMDRFILESIADKEYSELENDFNDLAQLDESPVWRNGKFRGNVSKIDAFFGTVDYFNSKYVGNFLEIAEAILIKETTKYMEEGDSDFKIRIMDNESNISDGLKESIVDTLLFLSKVGKDGIERITGIEISTKIDELITTLIGKLDKEKIKLHYQNFQKFAETSPEIFLNIMETELIPKKSLMKYMMKPVQDVSLDNVFYSNLLWALEILAWNPRYLKRVSVILAELIPYKNDRLGNSPQRTLFSLYRWYYPQTFADKGDREEVFDFLVDEYSDAAWHIIKQQIKLRSAFTPNSKPKWNDFINMDKDPSISQYKLFYFHCLDAGINWNNHSIDTLEVLVNHLNIGDDNKKAIRNDEIWNAIIKWGKSADDNDKVKLREYIKTKTSTRSKLAKVALKILTPNDLCLNYSWLFASYCVAETWDKRSSSRVDSEKYKKESEKKRRYAAKEIYDHGGIDEIIRFCNMLDGKHGARVLGITLTKFIDQSDIENLIVQIMKNQSHLEIDHYKEFILGFTSNVKEFNKTYLTGIIKMTDSLINREQQARWLSIFPADKHLWKALENYSVMENTFWKSFEVFVRSVPSEEIEFVSGKLLQFQRPYEAFLIACMGNFDEDNFSHIKHDKLYEILKEMPNFKIPEGFETHYHYEILHAIKILEPSLSRTVLANLECLYAMIFQRYGEKPKHLSDEISRNPEFFCDLVCHLFEKGNWKEHALEFFAIIKLSEEVYSDQQKLTNWINKVLECGKDKNEKDWIDHQIGDVLSKIPPESDCDWPTIELAKVIEIYHENTMLMSGIKMGRSNNVEMAETINEETIAEKTKISTKMEDRAKTFDNNMPNVAKLIRYFANSFKFTTEIYEEKEVEIKRHDMEA